MVTLDSENKPYCTKVSSWADDYILILTFDDISLLVLQDYTKKFSVVCAGCKKAITPKKGEVFLDALASLELVITVTYLLTNR